MVFDMKKYNLSSGAPLFSGEILKEKGQELLKPKKFRIRALSAEDAEQMADLSCCIYSSLRKGQECFIHRHDKAYYKSLFEKDSIDKSINYIGVFVDTKLIGMAYFRMIDNAQDLEEELPGHGLDFFAKKRGLGEVKIAALGARSVHPDYRGNHISEAMIDFRMEQAGFKGATDLINIVDRRNVWSMNPLMKKGFCMFGAGVDPADDGDISLMHRPVKTKAVYQNEDMSSAKYDDFTAIDKMLAEKRVGVAYDVKTEKVFFAKTNYYAKMKPQEVSTNALLFSKEEALSPSY